MKIKTINVKVHRTNYDDLRKLERKHYGRRYEKLKNFNNSFRQILDSFKKNGGKLEALKDN